MTLSFKVRYETVDCSGCHANRVRGVRCPDCGAKPDRWEVDQALLTRRRLVEGLEDILNTDDDAPSTSGHRLIADDVFGQFIQVLPRTFAGLRQLTQKDDSEKLRELLHDFVRLRGVVRRSRGRRPYLYLAEIAWAVTNHFEHSIRHYLQALQAATPLQGHHHEVEAQGHIDAIAAAVGELEDRLAQHNAVDTTSARAMAETVLTNELDRCGGTVEQLLEAGTARATELLGEDPAPDASLGLVLGEAAAAFQFDLARFDRIFTTTYRLLVRDEAKLRRVLQTSPEIVTDYVDNQVDIFNSCWNVMQILEGAQTDRQAYEGLLDLHISLLEGPAALVVRVLLLTVGPKNQPYLKLKEGHATSDLRSLINFDQQFAELTGGLDADLRSAKSHKLVEYRQTGISVTTRKASRFIDHDDLIDQVLMALETTSALVLALGFAMAKAGQEIDYLQLLGQCGIGDLDAAQISLKLLTGSDAKIDFDGSHLEIEVEAEPGSWALGSLVAGLGPILRAADTFAVTRRSSSGERRLEGPARPFAEPSPDRELDQHLRIIKTLWPCTVDGAPCLTAEHIRVFCARQSLELLQGPDKRMHDFRLLLDLAKLTNDLELESFLRGAMRLHRTGEFEQATYDFMQEWGGRTVDFRTAQ